MTEQGRAAAEAWQQKDFAEAWVRGDGSSDLLELPRRMAAALVAQDQSDVQVVIDIASGPGTFLACFLDEFPKARGRWNDASEVMLDEAHARLAPYGERVDFTLGDMTDLASLALPDDADVVVTSRAAHHLDREGLLTFYRSAASHLRPGGWLINLDHTGPAQVWDRRFRAVRPRFIRAATTEVRHHHNYPLPSVEDHLDGFAEAGLTDVEVAWKAFFTCLFMGRKS